MDWGINWGVEWQRKFKMVMCSLVAPQKVIFLLVEHKPVE
jgi:hypothetical protein